MIKDGGFVFINYIQPYYLFTPFGIIMVHTPKYEYEAAIDLSAERGGVR